MSPADGATCDPLASDRTIMPAQAVILPGGRSLLAIADLTAALPHRGQVVTGSAAADWRAQCWLSGEARAGIALIESSLTGAATLLGPAGDREGQILPPERMDVTPAALAAFVRANGLNGRDVFAFLIAQCIGDRAPEMRAFAAGFLVLAAEVDGFVEILACPQTGGLFAQGWAKSLVAGRHRIARLDGDLKLCEAEVATFARQDILPPGGGFCLFARDWRAAEIDALDCLFFEQEGALRRLEILRGSVLKLTDTPATEHVAQMLPRLVGDAAAFRRICRPRYQGIDTLSGTELPIAAAFDAVFQAPDGGVLATGWLLDPLRRVERVIIKSTSGLYAPLQDRWNPVGRPDLNTGFAHEPRFAGLLDPSDTLHGFLAYAPGRAGRAEGGEVYLELVLDDNSCLFRPVTVSRLDGREVLPQILAAVPLHDPALDRIVTDMLAPFLGQLPARQRPLRAAAPAIPLSASAGEIAAVMPVQGLAQLQPVMALLAGTAEAATLDLVLVMTRGRAGDAAERLVELFAFYGLSGRLVLVPDELPFARQVEAGLALAEGTEVLLWMPAALPRGTGWLSGLRHELAGLEAPGLISPMLVYEDGSVFYGSTGGGETNSSPLLGYPSDWLARGRARPMTSGAAQVALIDRNALARAGGYAGRLFSDAMIHHDLACRLQEAGFGTWCSGNVDFWMLDDAAKPADGPQRLLERVDAALMSGREQGR